jgi:Pectate lyase superfamily protein
MKSVNSDDIDAADPARGRLPKLPSLMSRRSALAVSTLGVAALGAVAPPSVPAALAATYAAGPEVGSIADLRALSKATNDHAFATGYYAQGDGGGGPYWYDSSDTTSSDNGGTIIVASDGGRWKLQLLGDVTVKQFGAKGDGVADDTSAIQAAINSFNGQPGVVFMPTGTYNVSSTIHLKATVSLRGSGSLTCRITPTVAGMTVFDQVFTSSGGSNLTLSDFFIKTEVANVLGLNAVYCNRLDLERVFFFGCLRNFAYDRGGLNRIIDCVSGPSNTKPAGSALMWSSTDTEYGFVFSQLTNYRIEGGGGVQSPAVYFRRAVGVKGNIMTSDSNYTGICILVENDCQGIGLSDSLIVGYAIGIVFQQGSGIAKAPIFNTLSNVDFDQNSQNAILVAEGRENLFIGGNITSSAVGTGTTAIRLVGQSSQENSFIGTSISGYYDTSGTGISLENTNSNTFANVKVDGSTTGVRFVDTNNTNTSLTDCDFSNGVTTAIAGSVANTGNRVMNCKGFSAAALVSSPAMVSSGGSVTNSFGVAVRVFIYGGSVSLLRVNGVGAGFSSGVVTLQPGESISLTYSSAPSWNWIGI